MRRECIARRRTKYDAADDDTVDADLRNFVEHRFQRRKVAVDIVEGSDAHAR
jgi:hypothetical protein